MLYGALSVAAAHVFFSVFDTYYRIGLYIGAAGRYHVEIPCGRYQAELLEATGIDWDFFE
jgi:hypothetical protein